MEIFGQPGFAVVQGLVAGVLTGGIYALIALGIVIINKASGVFNFAHGYMMLLGALIFWTFFQNQELTPVVAFALSGALLTILSTGIRYPAAWTRSGRVAFIAAAWATVGFILLQTDNLFLRALVGTALGAALVGLLIERLTIRPLIGQPLFATVMMTLVVGEVLLGVTQLTWGSVDRSLPIFATVNALGLPQAYPPIRIRDVLGGTVVIKTELLIAFGIAVAAFVGFVLFFRYTRLGLSMRATAENADLAQAVGLRVRAVLATAWAIASVLAALAATLYSSSTALSITMPGLALRVFPAVLLGGIESISGAFVGGIVIGVAEKLGTVYFGSDVGEQLIPFVVLMIVLIVRPSGLFGEERIERV
ncbi:MAG: branched-chain amino acid ABC transporter permease [Chloroflexi bacterium]|jgi:branched-chain amino acid transport system permease protein|nr:branched-chain amino acid ABC transporter permease [Chloroflexota bacterium]